MKARPRLFAAFRLVCLPVVAALAYAQPAHAGWLDDMFTFRTDQKPLVAPRRNLRPADVVQPYYPNDAHVAWSNFYTRTDLEPQDYLSSSASKVMRPAPAQQPAGGWPAIANRAAENAKAEMDAQPDQIAIGDPGEAYSAPDTGTMNVGRATRIGPAVNDWQDGGGNNLASRPGDYDYRGPVNVADGGSVAIGDAGADTTSGSVNFSTAQPHGDDPRYVGYNAKGQVNAYAVQKGDTLSSISGQPAIYGTWKLWPLIYSANRRAIGGNPHNLTTKQRLDIPRDYTDQQAKDAERRAGRF